MKSKWHWVLLIAFFILLSNCTDSANRPTQKLANELLQGMKESGQPVAARAGLVPDVLRAGESASLVAAIKIKPGWHIYAHGGVARYAIPTRLEVKFPEGISTVAGWEYPPGIRKPGSEELIYENSAVIRGSLKSAAGLSLGRRSIVCSVYYVACDDSVCLPPVAQSLKVDFDIIK
jgi:DsbC/DsbD-like thiol-disulfide interchange protein